MSLPEGATLEGYIFPDTYSLARDKITARDVVLAALRNDNAAGEYYLMNIYGKEATAFYDLHNGLRLQKRNSESLPTDLAEMRQQLTDQYLCDFSVFQSILDYWAIGQVFPIMPVHRLKEQPTRLATLVDLTCDSDGKVDRFVSPLGMKNALELTYYREAWQVDASITQTHFFAAAAVDNYWTPAIGVTRQLGQFGGVRAGYSADLGTGYTSHNLNVVFYFAL